MFTLIMVMLLLIPSISQRVSASSGVHLGNTISYNNGETGEQIRSKFAKPFSMNQMSLSNSIASSASQLGGVTISGLVTTYNPNNTVNAKLLLPNGDEAYTAAITIPADSEAGVVEYSFTNVEPGIYNLYVSKLGHLSYTKYMIYVGSDPFSLNPITLLVGDINNDGQIDGKDLILLSESFNKIGDNFPADLNGDEIVNQDDLALLRGNFGKSNIYDVPPNMT